MNQIDVSDEVATFQVEVKLNLEFTSLKVWVDGQAQFKG